MKLVELRPDTPEFEAVLRINAEAFPDNERLDLDAIIRKQPSNGKHFLGIMDDEGVLRGFFMIIMTEDCAYICYFAVDPACRGAGIGSKALALLFEYCGARQVVVDFEALDESAPNNEQRKRRRAFYLRNGFFPTGYFQYYMDCEFEIFSNFETYDRPAYERLIEGIKREVGNYLTPHYRKD